MILYAPIIGIGGIYKVAQTKANMGWIIALAVVLILGFVLLLVSISMPKFKAMQKLSFPRNFNRAVCDPRI